MQLTLPITRFSQVVSSYSSILFNHITATVLETSLISPWAYFRTLMIVQGQVQHVQRMIFQIFLCKLHRFFSFRFNPTFDIRRSGDMACNCLAVRKANSYSLTWIFNYLMKFLMSYFFTLETQVYLSLGFSSKLCLQISLEAVKATTSKKQIILIPAMTKKQYIIILISTKTTLVIILSNIIDNHPNRTSNHKSLRSSINLSPSAFCFWY